MEPFRQKVLLWHREAPLFLRVYCSICDGTQCTQVFIIVHITQVM